MFYGQGWLLTHYLYATQNRSGQLTRYLDLLNSGTPQPDAAQQAFGDLKQLQHELTIYKHHATSFGLKVERSSCSARTGGGHALVRGRRGSDSAARKPEAVWRQEGGRRAACRARFGLSKRASPVTRWSKRPWPRPNSTAATPQLAALRRTGRSRRIRKNVEGLIYKGRSVEWLAVQQGRRRAPSGV